MHNFCFAIFRAFIRFRRGNLSVVMIPNFAHGFHITSSYPRRRPQVIDLWESSLSLPPRGARPVWWPTSGSLAFLFSHPKFSSGWDPGLFHQISLRGGIHQWLAVFVIVFNLFCYVLKFGDFVNAAGPWTKSVLVGHLGWRGDNRVRLLPARLRRDHLRVLGHCRSLQAVRQQEPGEICLNTYSMHKTDIISWKIWIWKMVHR